MSQTAFTQQVLNDIHDFLNQNTKVFANEHDLQMNLAVYLKSVKHYDVEVEYHVPSGVIDTLLPQALPENAPITLGFNPTATNLRRCMSIWWLATGRNTCRLS